MTKTAVPQSISFAKKYRSHRREQGAAALRDKIPRAYILVSDFFARAGNYFSALASIELALECNPERAETNYKKGEIFRTLARYDEAIVFFETATNLKSNYLLAESAKKEAEALNYIHNIAGNIHDNEQIIKEIETRISKSTSRLTLLRIFGVCSQIALLFTLILIWTFLYSLVYIGDPLKLFLNLVESVSSVSALNVTRTSLSNPLPDFLLIVSISSATLLLVWPIIWITRHLHYDMKIERIVLEDIIRKRDILLLRLLHSGNPNSPQAREMIDRNSHLVIAHNAERGTADILQGLYSNKSAKAGDDSSSNSHISQLVSAIKMLIEHIKPNK